MRLSIVLCLPWLATVISAPLQGRATELPDLYEATFDELAAGLEAGDFTSVDLVKAYFARIEEVDYQGPFLRSVIQTSPVALEQAAYCDELRKNGVNLGILHGIPIIVKDNTNTDHSLGMNTTGGSYALINTVVNDAPAVKKLRDAGALILGKANLSQWAFWRSSNYLPSGWTSVGGQCTNPYYPSGNPSGSSGGSGVVAAIGLAAGTLGSDTGGSVLYPASANNVVGLRPTIGLISRAGVVPISSRHDTLGPMTRTVKDCAYLLQATAGQDPADNFTMVPEVANVPDYLIGLTPDALQGVRLGYPANLNGADLNTAGNDVPTGILEKMQETVALLESLGATVVQDFDLPLIVGDYLAADYSNVLSADFKVDLAEYLATVEYIPSGIKSLADLIAFNNENADLERPSTYESQDLFDQSEATPGRNVSGEYIIYTTAQNDIDRTLQQYNLDALIFPSPQSTFSTIARYPQLTVPLGFLPEDTTAVEVGNYTVPTYDPFPGKPYGLTFAGTGFSEAKLLAYGYAFEQASNHRLERKAYSAAIPKTQLKDV